MLGDDFNRQWAEYKNQFAREEAQRDQRAFEAKLDAEDLLNNLRGAGFNPIVVDENTFKAEKPRGARVTDPTKFVLAGHAIFTVENTNTHNRFTFKVSKNDREEDFFWVGVLTGPTNTSDYTCVGRIVKGVYIHNRSSKISESAQSNKVFAWFFKNMKSLPDFIQVWHCGYCCCCGRLLTTPESVAAGIGPVCAGR